MSEDTRELSAITIGERVRHDLGDLPGLAESMERVGLMHPIVILPDGVLVAGQRRLEAARLLGWERIPVTVVSVPDMLTAERDENTVRKDFLPSEALALGALIEAVHVARIAGQRVTQQHLAGHISQAVASGDDTKAKELRAQLPPKLGQARKVAASAVGMSESSYQRAKEIDNAARGEPEKYGDLRTQMDETRNVAAVHRELQHRKAQGTHGRSPVHTGKHHPKPNQEMQRAVTAIEGICLGLQSVDVKQLDAEKADTWALALSAAASFLRRLAKGMSNVNHDAAQNHNGNEARGGRTDEESPA